jgi:hypothetical protein
VGVNVGEGVGDAVDIVAVLGNRYFLGMISSVPFGAVQDRWAYEPPLPCIISREMGYFVQRLRVISPDRSLTLDDCQLLTRFELLMLNVEPSSVLTLKVYFPVNDG